VKISEVASVCGSVRCIVQCDRRLHDAKPGPYFGDDRADANAQPGSMKPAPKLACRKVRDDQMK
jgi:hypothetical protein